MAKRAFCVGINDYPIPGNDLKGCVNDARAWRDLLVDHFDFSDSDVTVITDGEATKRAIVDGLARLLEGASDGDVLVFTNSSHGSQIPDTSGDEERYDEVLCPYDTRQNVVVDDEVRQTLARLPSGVQMTVISDSCHSGSVTRAPINELLPPEFQLDDDRRVRFLNPALIPDLVPRGGTILADPMGAEPRKRIAFPESGMNHVLLSGCTDKESSWDARIGGTYHGAMTYHAVRAISDAGYEISYAELAERLQTMLDDARYYQHPQLEGKDEAKQRPVFT